LNCSDGVLAWSSPYGTGGRVLSSPAVGFGKVNIGSDSYLMYQQNAATGVNLRTFATSGNVKASPLLWEDGKIYVGSFDTDFYGIDSVYNNLGWSPYNAPTGAIYSSAWMDWTSDSLSLYFGDNDGKLYCISAKGTPNPKGWSTHPFQASSSIKSSPIVWNNRVYVGCDDGWFYSLNANTGILIWKFNTGNKILSSPAIDLDNNCIIIGTDGGKVYSFELE
jgi:outer membrane protein assembly factor BamB